MTIPFLAAGEFYARGLETVFACHTATLQSTPMAEHVHAAVGSRDLGQILELGRLSTLKPNTPGARS